MERRNTIGRGFRVLAASMAAGLAAGWFLVGVRVAPGAVAYSSIPPASKTNAPGEGLCAECHTGGLNSGGGSLSVLNAPAEYVAGQTYSLVVQLAQTGQQRWGFELTSLRDSLGIPVQAGYFTRTSDSTALQSAPVGGRTRFYVSHFSNGIVDGTYAGTLNGPVSWTFDWTAPPSGSGAVTFYAAGNAANGNGLNGAGDYIYTATATVPERAPTAVSATTWGKIKRAFQERASAP